MSWQAVRLLLLCNCNCRTQTVVCTTWKSEPSRQSKSATFSILALKTLVKSKAQILHVCTSFIIVTGVRTVLQLRFTHHTQHCSVVSRIDTLFLEEKCTPFSTVPSFHFDYLLCCPSVQCFSSFSSLYFLYFAFGRISPNCPGADADWKWADLCHSTLTTWAQTLRCCCSPFQSCLPSV